MSNRIEQIGDLLLEEIAERFEKESTDIQNLEFNKYV